MLIIHVANLQKEKKKILRAKRNHTTNETLFVRSLPMPFDYVFFSTEFFFFFCIYFARTPKHSRVGCWLYKSFALHAKSIFILELLVFLVFSAFTTLRIITAFVVSFNFLIAIKTHFEIKSDKQAEIKKKLQLHKISVTKFIESERVQIKLDDEHISNFKNQMIHQCSMTVRPKFNLHYTNRWSALPSLREWLQQSETNERTNARKIRSKLDLIAHIYLAHKIYWPPLLDNN